MCFSFDYAILDILRKGLESHGLGDRTPTFDEATLVIDWVIDYHVSAGVSGVSLCEACHRDRHLEDSDLD